MAFIEPMHRNKPNITYLLTGQCIDLDKDDPYTHFISTEKSELCYVT